MCVCYLQDFGRVLAQYDTATVLHVKVTITQKPNKPAVYLNTGSSDYRGHLHILSRPQWNVLQIFDSGHVNQSEVVCAQRGVLGWGHPRRSRHTMVFAPFGNW